MHHKTLVFRWAHVYTSNIARILMMMIPKSGCRDYLLCSNRLPEAENLQVKKIVGMGFDGANTFLGN